MKKIIEDFKKFIKRGNVVDMAVGVAVAAAFTAIVTAFTKGFITPFLALITGESDLDEMKWIIRDAVMEGEEVVEAEIAILWGPFVHAIMDFLIIALSLFIVMRVAAGLRNRAEKISKKARDMFTDLDEKEAEAALEAERAAAEEKRLAEEAAALEAEKAREAERLAAEEIAAEKARLERQEQLLTDIRDLLKQQK